MPGWGWRGWASSRPWLIVCLCCRDAGDELLLTVLRCTSVSGPSLALVAPFGTATVEAWL